MNYLFGFIDGWRRVRVGLYKLLLKTLLFEKLKYAFIGVCALFVM